MKAPRHIFHVALPDDWDGAQAAGEYTTSTRNLGLAEQGFIHCCLEGQLAHILSTYYADVEAVLILTVDTALIDAEVKLENSDGLSEQFPHVYGPIPIDAVVSIRRWYLDSGRVVTSGPGRIRTSEG